jgi:hypothetical protein
MAEAEFEREIQSRNGAGIASASILAFEGVGWPEWPEQESSAWVGLASYTAVLFGEEMC